MVVYHDDAVFSLPGCPGRTIFYARRIGAMIAHEENGLMLQIAFEELILLLREYSLIRSRPCPFDLFLQGAKVRHVVNTMTGSYTVYASILFPTGLGVDNHGPPYSCQRFPD
jgi:hypothetical protein